MVIYIENYVLFTSQHAPGQPHGHGDTVGIETGSAECVTRTRNKLVRVC